MAVDVHVVKTLWAGTSGGAGVTQMAIQETVNGGWTGAASAQTAVNAVRTFWQASINTYPNEIQLTVSPTVDAFLHDSGTLVGSDAAATPPAVVSGTNTGSYSMAAGGKLQLKTATIRNGRRVRGSLFIVPCAGDVFDSNGQATTTPRTGWINAMNTLRTTLNTASLELVVWSRPTIAGGGSNGNVAAITSVDSPAKGAILRSRRD